LIIGEKGINVYTNSKTWNLTLVNQTDNNDQHRNRLRVCFEAFRGKIEQFIQVIPAEIPGLTVHDITHLDAMWEMADILLGEDYELNPAEAFVLGGAILLHDSAMTICAYDGGVEEIKNMVEYSDAIAQLKAANNSSDSPPLGMGDIEKIAISEVLRIKHASKAEELASQAWVSPLDNSKVMLIEDPELRDHFSNCIGRIANSHHWNIEEVSKKLSNSLGSFSGFPSDWTVDERLSFYLQLEQLDHCPKLIGSFRIY
jgi:hypothetical protein